MNILRIRTNVGVFRVEILNQAVTIQELKEKIISSLRILDIKSSNLLLALDLENTKTLNRVWDDRTISDVCSTFNCSCNGMILYLVGKYEKMEVAKSYVDGDGSVVKEGTMLKKLDTESSEEIKNESPSQENIVSQKVEAQKKDDIQLSACRGNQNFVETPAVFQRETDHDDRNENLIDEHDETNRYDFYDDEIRAPDESKNMKLIDEFQFNSDNAVALNATDIANVEMFMKQLKDAGLNDQDILMECQEFSDEIIAKKVQSEQNYSPFEAHFHPAIRSQRTSPEELQRILYGKKSTVKRQPTKTSSHRTNEAPIVSREDFDAKPSHKNSKNDESNSSYVVEVDDDLPTRLNYQALHHRARQSIKMKTNSKSHSSTSSELSGNQKRYDGGLKNVKNSGLGMAVGESNTDEERSSSHRPSHSSNHTSKFLNSNYTAQSEDDDLELAIKLSLQESQQVIDEKIVLKPDNTPDNIVDDDEVSLIAHIPAIRKNSVQSSKRLPPKNTVSSRPSQAQVKQETPQKTSTTSSQRSSHASSKAPGTPSSISGKHSSEGRPLKQRKGSNPSSTLIDSNSSHSEYPHTSTTTEATTSSVPANIAANGTSTTHSSSRQRFHLSNAKNKHTTTAATEVVTNGRSAVPRSPPSNLNPPPLPVNHSNRRVTADANRAMMRDHLHRGISLPRSLATSIHQQTQQQMMEMAMTNSLVPTNPYADDEEVRWERDNREFLSIPHERNPQARTSSGELPEYFEDDEMLAQALHESLNGH